MVEGVGLGSSRARIERRFGRAHGYSQTEGNAPIKAGDLYEEGWPALVAPPPRRFWRGTGPFAGIMRYDRLAFDTVPKLGAYYVQVADSRWRTREGVRYGDSLKSARERYPFLRCGIENKDSEYVPYPYCKGRAARGVNVWFGQDPIRSISMARTFMG